MTATSNKLILLIVLVLFANFISAQNVGIGTTNPTSTLHLNSQLQILEPLKVDFESGNLNPGNNNSDLKWEIENEAGAGGSAKSMKSPYLPNIGHHCSILFPYTSDLDKIVQLSFDVKFDAATNVRLLEVKYESQVFTLVKENTSWTSYSVEFTSSQTQGEIEFRLESLVASTNGTVRVDNIKLSYETGQALKITDGNIVNGNFLETDALGHVKSYDLRSDIEQGLLDNLQNLDFNTTSKQLSIENSNTVNISALQDATGAFLNMQDTMILGSTGLSLYLPKNGSQQAYLFWDQQNSSFYTGRDPTSPFLKGAYSTRFGLRNTATDLASTVFGIDNLSEGYNSFVFGINNVANGDNSVAWGKDNFATESVASAWGINNEAQGFASTAWGRNNVIYDSLGTAFGQNNTIYGTHSFAAGDANEIVGDRSLAFGTNNTLNGDLGFSAGEDNVINGDNGFALGFNNHLNGNRSVAWGIDNWTIGENSTVFGNNNTARGTGSTCGGLDSETFGDYSASFGVGLNTYQDGEFAVGRYNASHETGPMDSNFLFTVGNGTSTNSENAFVVHDNGYCGINRTIPQDYLDIYMNTEDHDGITIKQDNDLGSATIGFEGFNQRIKFTSTNNPEYSIIHQDNNFNRLQIWYNFAALMTFVDDKVGIKESFPDYQLQLGNNSAAKPSSSSWSVASDQRLKTDVKPFEDGLSLIDKINPVWFTYNGQAGMPRETAVGTLAQELQKIAPYMVHNWQYRTDENPEGDTYLAVDYGSMDFVLINSIKEQQEMIENLQTLLLEQQLQLDLQQAQIEKLIEIQVNSNN